MVIYLFFGIAASLAGFVFSPEFRPVFKDLDSASYVLRCSLMMGCLIGLFSNICNHDVRMWYKSKFDYIVNVFVAAAVGLSVSVVLFYIFKIDLVGRWVLFLTLIIYVSLVSGWVANAYKGLDRLVYLSGDGAKMFMASIDSSRLKFMTRFEIISEAETIFNLKDPVWRGEILPHRFYIIPDGALSQEFESAIVACGNLASSCVMSANQAFEREFECVDINWVNAHKWWEVESPLRRSQFILLKRILDLFLVSIIVVPALVVIGIAAIGIKLTDGGPIFYRQTRLGIFRKPFCILKIRTMVVHAEKAGAQWAGIGDPRVTWFGKLLRQTRIDELPQIWNIFLGDMSFIGPRPERPEFFSMIEKEYPLFGVRLLCKPGLTGWAQVNYPYGASISDSVVKLMYDMYYIKNANIFMEIKIMIRTVFAMVKGAR